MTFKIKDFYPLKSKKFFRQSHQLYTKTCTNRKRISQYYSTQQTNLAVKEKCKRF